MINDGKEFIIEFTDIQLLEAYKTSAQWLVDNEHCIEVVSVTVERHKNVTVSTPPYRWTIRISYHQVSEEFE